MNFFKYILAVFLSFGFGGIGFASKMDDPDKPLTSDVETSTKQEIAEKLEPMTRGLERNAVLWTGGRVYFRWNSEVTGSNREKIKLAMKILEKGTCIRFYETPDRTKGVIEYRLVGRRGTRACYSKVGYIASESQELVLTPGACDDGTNYAGSALHELLHALGFVHEFQRNDRDNYLIFLRRNVNGTDDEVNVNYGVENDLTKGIPFNYKSIMQYDPHAGAIRRGDYVFQEKKPIATGAAKPIGNFKNMGQECKLSAGDRNLIEQVYYRECGKRAPTVYPNTKAYDLKINGTDCREKLEPMNDMI